MAQAVSHRPLTAEARVRSRVSPCRICGAQSDTGTRFPPSPVGSPLSASFRQCSILSFIVTLSYQKNKLRSVRTFKLLFRISEEHCRQKYFLLLFRLLTALHSTESRGPRITTNWNSSEHCSDVTRNTLKWRELIGTVELGYSVMKGTEYFVSF
jgi:hypothetical protein